MQNKMNVRIFNSFYIEDTKSAITEEDLHSNKVTRLLAYMIINRDRVVDQIELLEVLFWKKSKNPAGALKNLIYRVRTALKPLSDEEFILTVSGGYRWNPEISVDLDCDRFEHIHSLIMEGEEEERKKRHCVRAIEMYGTNLTKRVVGEPWAAPLLEKYRSMYTDIVKVLGEMYEKKSDWEMLEGLTEKAITQVPLDEDLQYMLIRSLTGQKKYDQAMKQYEQANKMFFQAYGVHGTDKLRNSFQDIFSQHGSKEMDIMNLLSELDESKGRTGAFLCDYQVFRQIYRVEERRLARSGMSEYIVLITVRPKQEEWNNREDASQKMREIMDDLENLLHQKLRAGDVISRYNMTQYLVLLPACLAEHADMVMRRVQRQFSINIGRSLFEFTYEMEEV